MLLVTTDEKMLCLCLDMIIMGVLIQASINSDIPFLLMRASSNRGWNLTLMRGYDNGGRFCSDDAWIYRYINYRECLWVAAVLVAVLLCYIVSVVCAPLMMLLPLLSCYCHFFFVRVMSMSLNDMRLNDIWCWILDFCYLNVPCTTYIFFNSYKKKKTKILKKI